eukprot:361186-Chlamydomonas_euryale.AAC.6
MDGEWTNWWNEGGQAAKDADAIGVGVVHEQRVCKRVWDERGKEQGQGAKGSVGKRGHRKHLHFKHHGLQPQAGCLLELEMSARMYTHGARVRTDTHATRLQMDTHGAGFKTDTHGARF